MRVLAGALLLLLALTVFQQAALADGVTLTLGQPTTPTSNGVYTSPYPITVNGLLTSLICDTYNTEIYVGYSWDATVIPLADAGTDGSFAADKITVGGTTYDSQQMYNAAAILASEILNTSPSSYGQTTIDESYAIWGLFEQNPPTLTPNQTTLLDNALADLASPPPNIVVYVPTGGINGQVGGNPPYNVSQEFFGVPDGGMTLMLLGGALVGLETLRRKFRV